jgi:uncharacterized RDD family membrane protein YckC
MRPMPGEPIDTATRVETPEHIAFEFRLAGPWRRAWAYVIDVCLRLAALLAIVIGAALTSAVLKVEELVGANVALVLLAWFAVEWFYHVLFEWLWSGCTPGKKALGLRVVKEGGHPVGLQEALLRNLLRAADLLPPIALGPLVVPTYLFGSLVAAADPRFRRLGDLAAGTLVVVEEPARLRAPARIEPPASPAELAQVPAHPRLSVEEKKTVDAFVRRFKALHPARREELCDAFARDLARRLGAQPPRSAARFLQLVYARLSEDVAAARRPR